MSEYIVTARKWRPLKFEDVTAQDHITVTLRNAIATKRLAHAYLFSGPRGVGKTTTARILAKAVNCLSPIDFNPDNECLLCREITEGRSFDVLEIDGASNRGVEEIRNLRDSVRYAPSQGKYKVYIIDEVHMLTKEAFNALLKTLEEPPAHVLFIFATTEIHKLPATILSRCQRFEFRRIAIDKIMGNLRAIAATEGVEIDEESLMLVARKGDGSLRDAQSTFDQVVSLCGKKVEYKSLVQAMNVIDVELFFNVTDLVKTKDAHGGLQLVEGLMIQGNDLREFLSGLTEHLRNILVAKTTKSSELIEASDVYRKRYMEEAGAFTLSDLLRMQRQVSTTEAAIRWSSQPRFRLEVDLVQMITMQKAVEVGELLRQLEEMKKKLPEGASVVATPPERMSVPSSGVREPEGNAGPPKRFVRRVSPLPEVSPASPQITTAPLSEGEVASRWNEFISEVRRQRISLGSVLESTTLLGSEGGTIRIGCANDFQASSVRRNKEMLSGIIQKVFNTNARLEVEINPALQHAASDVPSSSQPTVPTVSKEEHPIVSAMKRELGAEPLQ
ncbi:MAG: DNA polymerase III subunit gamma/tau [Bacteroidota bacterium]